MTIRKATQRVLKEMGKVRVKVRVGVRVRVSLRIDVEDMRRGKRNTHFIVFRYYTVDLLVREC